MADATILDLYRGDLERPREHHYGYVTAQGRQWQSTLEFQTRTAALAEALHGLGVGVGDRVLLLSDNRPEWHQVDLATLSIGAVSVPIYPTLSASEVAYHTSDSGAVLAVSENPAQTAKLLACQDRCPELKHIVQIEGTCPGEVQDLQELLALHRGAAAESTFWSRAEKISPDDLATIVYTSGTTGQPKGVMLSHRNFTSNVTAVLPRVPVTADDHALEFLPLCHVFERICGYAYMKLGVTRTYCPPELVADSIASVAPTVFASVPRLFEKIHSTITTRVREGSGVKRGLFGWAVAVGRKATPYRLAGRSVPLPVALQLRLADRLVLKKVRNAFGGRVRYTLSGGAPLARELNEFFHAVGIPVHEGYGLTETSPGISISGHQPGHNKLGAVGRPLENLEVKIATDGEILVKGPSVFKGYWQRPDETRESFDADGFFRTGDIGRLDGDGFLHITDRKKDIIIPAGGNNVAPQPIENLLKTMPFVDNAVLVGDRRAFVAALISPAEEEIRAWAEAQGVTTGDLSHLVADPGVQAIFDRVVADVNSELERHARIKKFRVLPKPLAVEDGYLTPTLKVRRRAVERDFADTIEEIYAA